MAGSVRPTLPLLLTINAGYIDTASFLALQGLFAAHVTGNFVTLGASLVHGTSGTLSKLIALPMFCVVIVVTRAVSHGLRARSWPVLRTMLMLKLLLLVLAAVLAIRFGPFSNADAPLALLMGQLLVSAMAIQNAAHRIHLGSAPPTTLMTGTTTQMMIDVADLISLAADESRHPLEERLKRMTAAVLSFALGCGLAALLYSKSGMYCFLVPPMLGAAALSVRAATDDPR